MKHSTKQRILALSMAGAMAFGMGVAEGPQVNAKKSSIDKLFAGGKGTKAKPYQIKTAKQLENIGKNKTTLKKHYILKKNIDFKNKTIKNIGSVTMDQMNKGDMSLAFSGTFDGKGHTISNVKVNTEKKELGAGLFEIVTGTVKNVTVKDVVATGSDSSMFSGGVVGMAYGNSTVSNVKTTGKSKISGVNCTGGVVGGSWGAQIKKCSADGVTIIVNGDNDFSTGVIEQADSAETGGLIIGGGFTGTVSDCTASGTVKATGNEPVGLGGIGGCLQCMDLVSANTATVTIQGKNGHAIGGLCGYAGVGDDGDGVIQDPATIKDCHVNVKIECGGSATHVGGLIGTGLYYYGMEDRFNVVDCSVKGSITGAVTPGTVAGRATGSTITSCDADVTIDGVKGTDQIGTTTRLYMSGDQYPEGSSQAAAVHLKNLAGTYQGLFETICDQKYDSIWEKYAATIVGADAAAATAKALKDGVTSKYMGSEAVDYYTKNPESSMAFNCFLTQNVASFSVEGDVITGYDKSGTKLFSHSYKFDSYAPLMGEIGLDIYKTDDKDAGEFTYFAFAGDTIQTSYHLELRYGDNLEDIKQPLTGKYAYWLAAGITKDPDPILIDHVIQLFVIENLKQ